MLAPYTTERDLRRMPWATISLIGLNVALYVAAVSAPRTMIALVLNPGDFHWWQPVTGLFMHGGFMHLGYNMLFLWVFGSHVEDVLGMGKFLLLYFSAGFAADILQGGMDLVLLHEVRPSLGASGAIMGLVALFATRFRSVPVHIFYWFFIYLGTFKVKALWMALFYVGSDLVFGTLGMIGLPSSVAHFAHLGGFVCGVAWSYALHLPDEAAYEDSRDEVSRHAIASPRQAAVAAAAEAQQRPWDPRLHWLAARYFSLDDGTLDKAVDHWNTALRLWLAQGERQEAVEHWQSVADQCDPARLDPQIAWQLALLLEQTGSRDDAIRLYAAVASKHADREEAAGCALRLADALKARGKRDDARRWYTYVRRRWPDSYEALEAETRLRQLDY